MNCPRMKLLMYTVLPLAGSAGSDTSILLTAFCEVTLFRVIVPVPPGAGLTSLAQPFLTLVVLATEVLYAPPVVADPQPADVVRVMVSRASVVDDAEAICGAIDPIPIAVAARPASNATGSVTWWW